MKQWLVVILGLGIMWWLLDREKMLGVISRSLPAEEAGVLAGMVAGERGGMEREFYEKLKKTGVVHLVVVSGSNIMLVAGGLIEGLAWWLGRKRAIVLGLGTAWMYTAMVGWEIPVLRAVLLLSVFYWAQMLGRKFDLVRGLILVAGLMAMADLGIMGEISFWLSMTAFVGVITGGKNVLKQTIWVSLWVTPILGLVFGEISLMAPVANLMVISITEVITIVGGIGALIGGVAEVVGKCLLWLIFPLLRYFVWFVGGMGEMGFVSVGVRFNWVMLAGWYIILIYFLSKNKLKNL